MKSLFKTIIAPYGERYNNSKKVGDETLELNASITMKDYHHVNRIGVVIEPSYHEPVVQKGDLVIVHHNVFRQYWGFSTHLRTSSSDLDDGTFAVNNDSIYAYKGKNGWVTLKDYCFVEPIQDDTKDLTLDLDPYKKHYGKIALGAPEGLTEGDTISFLPFSEHEYEIDGKKLYRMRHRDLTGHIL